MRTELVDSAFYVHRSSPSTFLLLRADGHWIWPHTIGSAVPEEVRSTLTGGFSHAPILRKAWSDPSSLDAGA
ncbi:MAG: hypothetical protein Nkreftii_002922 [Candidatus Nitrospira kreftii]|uniref:Uncharacterized protein n=1 Tax=Candidatus Nitrospira kreftii TaxID=2652173 RepID=A0A7S8J0B1_9BACT|nr:MAG: hypothetical protein Nkreftii_002922 [Candidatus Nitrospira kreftii]